MKNDTDKSNTKYTGTAYGEASAEEVKEILTCCYEANMPVMLVGDPGVGKTALINSWSIEHGLKEPIPLIGSQMEPQDIVGLPMASDIEIDGKRISVTDYGAPWWQVALMTGERKTLFLDEFSNSPATIQSGELKLVGDHVFGNGEKVPDDAFIVMAMNPENSAVDYTPIAAPMANRIVFVSYRPTDKEVYEGLTGAWFTKEQRDAWSDCEVKWRERIVEFLRATNGTYILKMNDVDEASMDSSAPAWLNPDSENSDSEREILTTSWPSPRAWDNVARVLGHTSFEREITPLQTRILSGTVGRQAAVYLADYVHQHAHIDAFELIKHPEKQNWRVSGNDGDTYNDVLEIARDINLKVRKCDGLNGRPTVKQALAFYDKVVDLGGGAHFMSAFCQDPDGPGTWLTDHRPSDCTGGEWVKQILAVKHKYLDANLVPINEKARKVRNKKK